MPADELKQSEMDTQANGAGTEGKDNVNSKPEDAGDLQAQLAELQAQLKKVNAESASRRKQLEAYEAEQERRKEAEMTEAEKLTKRIEKMQAENAALQKRYESTLIRAAVTNAAHAQGFRDAEVAMKLLPEGAVTLDGDGAVIGADEALKALAKEHSYLLNQSQTSDPDAGKHKSDKKAPDLEAIARKYGI